MSIIFGNNVKLTTSTCFLLALIVLFSLPQSVGFAQQPTECCVPTSFDQKTYSASAGETIRLAELLIESNCYDETIAEISILEAGVDPTPISGSFSFFMEPSSVTTNVDISAESDLMVTISSDLSPGIYRISVLVEVSCDPPQEAPQSSTREGVFDLTVQPSEDQRCCSPTIETQQTDQATPGESFTLTTVSVENECATDLTEGETGTEVQVQDVTVSPEPKSGTIEVIPVATASLGSQATGEIPLTGSVSPEVPDGIYEVRIEILVICRTIFEEDERIILTKTFTLEVGSPKEDALQRGLRISSSMLQGTCAAPGTTLVIPVSQIDNPVDYKWNGSVLFGQDQRPMDLIAASERAVVTVVPPGLEGQSEIFVSGSTGKSNPATIRVDPTCASNHGEPITEERLRELAEEVPEDLTERATNETGELLSFIPGEIVIQIDAPPSRLEELREEYGIASLDRLVGTNLYVARLEDRSVVNTIDTADALAGVSDIQFARENGLMTEVQEDQPNDPELEKQEQFKTTNLFSGWQYFFPIQGRGITIAVVDTGLDLKLREELRTSPRAPNGLNVAAGQQDLSALIGTSTAEDRRGHGTIVGGLAAANGNNNRFGAGVAFNSRILPIKVFGKSRFASKDIIAKGLMAAYYLKADVVNMSLGCSRCRPSKERESRKYFARVIDQLERTFDEMGWVPPIVVAATGNDGQGIIDSPAADPRVIAIGSWNHRKKKVSDFSNYGEEIDFVAPGEHVFTALKGGKFGDAGFGTSFSSPQAAGLVALLISTQPKLKDLGVDAVREKIKKCFSIDVAEEGFDKKTGWGLINIPDPERVNKDECLVFKK